MKLRDKLKKNNTLYRFFEANIEKIKPYYNKTTPIDYTFHGIEHCEQIEKDLDRLIPDKLLLAMSTDEIFVLLNGVYYHDIGMIGYNRKSIIDLIDEGAAKTSLILAIKKHPKLDKELSILEVNRDFHNVVSASMIYYGDTEYNMGIIDVPDFNYAKSIASLCKGHRNYKLLGNEIDTLNEIDEKEHYTDKPMHTRFLASLLRIADELDVNYRRAPFQIFLELRSILSEKSKNEWNDHRLINSVEIDSNNSKIIFHPNKEIIKVRDKENNNDRTIVRNVLFTKRKKVEQELENVRKYIYDNATEPYKLGYEKISIKYDESLVTKSDSYNYKIYYAKVFEIETSSTKLDPIDSIEIPQEKVKSVQKIDKVNKFNKIIKSMHDCSTLISSGSFFRRSKYYTRFYLNTNIFLPQSEILNLITDIFTEKYNNDLIDCVIGVDNAGHILAPNLSLKLKCNYTYLIIKEDDKELSITFEKNSDIKKSKNSLIVTDVISTGDTIKKAIEEVKGKFKPENLYVACVFSTNNESVNYIKSNYKDDIYILNDDYQFKYYSQNEIETDISLFNEFNILKIISK
jgi:orotate phosphoribosyltransferase